MGAKRCLRFQKGKEVDDDRNSSHSISHDKSLTNVKLKEVEGSVEGNAQTKSNELRFKPPVNYSTWNGRLRTRRNASEATHATNNADKYRESANTSDYGTASESSRKSSAVETPLHSSYDQMSGVSSLEDSPVLSEFDVNCRLSATGWESEVESLQNGAWDLCDDFEINQTFQKLKEQGVDVKIVHSGGVVTLLPCSSSSSSSSTANSSLCNYKLKMIKEDEYGGTCKRLGTVPASHVVGLEPPYGSSFFMATSYPAIIFLPLLVDLGPTDVLECLYSNSTTPTATTTGAAPQWEKMSSENYYISAGKVVISTHHFNLITVVVRPQLLESRRLIRQRSGGRLRNPTTPGVEINFPRGSLQEDITASVRVLFDDEIYERRALASPIVMVGPHGYQFRTDQPAVSIRLPIPDYVKITDQFDGKLSVWQSSTSEDEPAFWERIDVDVIIERDSISRLYTARFPVYHFSFFKILWDCLSTSLFEAKMGMSHFYPYISFSMMCQAFMEENADTSRFGLEVICHRSDRRLPELTNYKHRVGASLKPKLIKPGKIFVRLKSQLFEADIDAGEDQEMVKEEYDFRGRDFEKQYACR